MSSNFLPSNPSSDVQGNGPRLISINASKESPWFILETGSGILLEGDGAPILSQGLGPGMYGMTWNLFDDRDAGESRVCFDLFDGYGEHAVEQLVLPLIPYFSGVMVSMSTCGVFGENRPMQQALSDLFPEAAKPPNILNLVNQFILAQSSAFAKRMNQWIDFSDPAHANILPNVSLMIGSTFMAQCQHDPWHCLDRPLVVLPEGYDRDDLG